MMMYKFIENDKQTITCDDFKPIINVLYKLHSNNYVHSDVRLENMVFPNNKVAKLIDFYLTDTVGMDYPFWYNYDLLERHPDAFK